ncbi:hypothetical protein F66182_12565, partial [Fusarium sp. NRRL 66182]
MDSLIHHLNSIAKDLEAARNEAAKQYVKYQDDTDKLNKKIGNLEYQRRTDQQRIKKLQSDIAGLQRYKKAADPGAHEEDVVVEEVEDDGSDDSMIEAKLQKLKEKYDPEKATAISWP